MSARNWNSGGNSGDDNHPESYDMEKDDKVTFLGYFNNPYRLIIGSKEGCVTIYNIAKRTTESFSMA